MTSSLPKVLVVDVGGTNVKLMNTGRKSAVKVPSGESLTPVQMMEGVQRVTADWEFDVVAMGFPSPVVHGRILKEPVNLGIGWVGFDFEQAFGKPVRIANDATMQALGGYTDGRMFFIGLGTGMGTALVDHGHAVSLEVQHLPYRNRSMEDYLSTRALKRDGKTRWQRRVHRITEELCDAFVCDYVVLGGGNSKALTSLPPRARLGDNANAFKGGFRMWGVTAEGERV
ncbi:MAG: ROK family protein [Gemmatimonas sp.]